MAGNLIRIFYLRADRYAGRGIIDQRRYDEMRLNESGRKRMKEQPRWTALMSAQSTFYADMSFTVPAQALGPLKSDKS